MKRIMLAIGFAFSFCGLAAAHSWYPPECCHQQDCAPAKVELLPSGELITSSFHGRATIGPHTRLLESKDSQSHVCIRAGKAVCFFIPPLN